MNAINKQTMINKSRSKHKVGGYLMPPYSSKPVDYPRIDYQYRQHFKRLKIKMEKEGLLCQECQGGGEVIEDYLDTGITGCYEYIYGMCGWCQGIGLIHRWVRGQWLKYKRQEALSKRLI